MKRIACLCFAIFVCVPLWSQVEPSAMGGGFSLDDSHMMTPPPVSGDAYPVSIGAESARSNFIAGGVIVSGSYSDNIMVYDVTHANSDTYYSIVPTLSLDRRTPHQGISLSYSSGIGLYQKTTSLNGVTQDANAGYRFHVTPYVVFDFSDSFHQNSSLLSQPTSLGAGTISGGSPSPISVYVSPYQKELGNTVSGGVEYQYGRNAMVGGSVNDSILRYSASTNVSGLSDSNVKGGTAFWSRRVTRGQYLGASYAYSNITTHPVQSTTNTHTIFGFYTMYLTRTISLSILGGPQHYMSRDPLSGASSQSWAPAVEGSAGYQTTHLSIAANLSHIVSNAGGLVGAFHSDIAGIELRRQLTARWGVGANASYALFKNVTPNVASFNPGGHTISGDASVTRNFRERFRLSFGYARFHQSYSNLGPSGLRFPDSNRAYASAEYVFSRSIGR